MTSDSNTLPPGAASRCARGLALAAALLVVAPGCAWVLRPFRGVPPALVEVDPENQPDFTDDLDLRSLRTAAERSIGFFERQGRRRIVAGNEVYEGADFASALRGFLAALGPESQTTAVDRALGEHFRVLRATGAGHAIRFTGYYTPLLRGSLAPTDEFRYALYAKPPDLLTFDLDRVVPGCDCATGLKSGRLENGAAVPYYTRADIDALGALKGRGLEIAWTDDRIGLFFLHIQGSGQIELPDGRRIHANFAGANGRAFHSIATKLAARGALPQGGSMQAVRAYLEAHPEEREGLLNDNPRYIFFTLADSGPFGSTELQLTAGRSIATDPAVFPPGALAYVRTKMPVTNAAGQVTTWATIHRFVLNQDTGGAIKGPARVDFYFGSGTAAGEIAGRMWAAGEMYFFLPRTRSLTTTARTARNAGRVSSSALDRPRG